MLAFALFVRGVGLGMTMMPSMAAAYQTLSRAAVPRATSLINIIRTVGGSVGVAVLTVILERQLPGSGGSLASIAGAGDVSAIAGPLAAAFAHTFWWAVGLTALALIPAWFLPRHPPAAPEAAGTASTPRMVRETAEMASPRRPRPPRHTPNR